MRRLFIVYIDDMYKREVWSTIEAVRQKELLSKITILFSSLVSSEKNIHLYAAPRKNVLCTLCIPLPLTATIKLRLGMLGFERNKRSLLFERIFSVTIELRMHNILIRSAI